MKTEEASIENMPLLESFPLIRVWKWFADKVNIIKPTTKKGKSRQEKEKDLLKVTQQPHGSQKY